MRGRRVSGAALVLALLCPALAAPAGAAGLPAWLPAPPPPSGGQAADRLAEPVLGESPTQVERGRSVYYYHCMPCHGDRGQGLTDEFRAIWPEDHQNCWARGCHTGKAELAAFAIPREIPALVGESGSLGALSEPETLFAYLHQTHPPQRPGALTDAEYWEVTAFLLVENGRTAEVAGLAARVPRPPSSAAWALVAGAAPLLALAAAGWLKRRSESTRA
jgi:mono/diheme cytochrome c family protein